RTSAIDSATTSTDSAPSTVIPYSVSNPKTCSIVPEHSAIPNRAKILRYFYCLESSILDACTRKHDASRRLPCSNLSALLLFSPNVPGDRLSDSARRLGFNLPDEPGVVRASQ